jgi:peptidoglycan-N-acetylglucosamine deacetylase
LSHDIHAGTIAAMPATFDELQAKGFKFVTVSELIAMGKPKPAQETTSEGATPSASPATTPSPTATPAPSLTKP